MAKIKPGSPPHKTLHIPVASEIDPEATLRFSFKHVDLTSNQKFCVDRCGDGYLDRFLSRLRDVCGTRVKDFRADKSPVLKAHKIEWRRTSEPDGFLSLNDQLRAKEPWQFAITRNEHGRVHGILLDDTFYVIWIDPDHLLFS